MSLPPSLLSSKHHRFLQRHASVIRGCQLLEGGLCATSDVDYADTIDIWNIESGDVVWQLPNHSAVYCMITHADWLITGHFCGNIRVWSIETRTLLHDLLLQVESPVQGLLVWDEHFLIGCGQGAHVKVWDLRTGQLLTQLPHPSHVEWYLGLLRDGDRLLGVGQCKYLYEWTGAITNAVDDITLREIPIASNTQGLRRIIRFHHYLVTAGYDNCVRFLNPTTLKQVRCIRLGGWVWTLATNGARLFCGAFDSSVTELNIAGEQRQRIILLDENKVNRPYATCFKSPHLVIATRMGEVHFWNIGNREPPPLLELLIDYICVNRSRYPSQEQMRGLFPEELIEHLPDA